VPMGLGGPEAGPGWGAGRAFGLGPGGRDFSFFLNFFSAKEF
jgi:hypothetical protein